MSDREQMIAEARNNCGYLPPALVCEAPAVEPLRINAAAPSSMVSSFVPPQIAFEQKLSVEEAICGAAPLSDPCEHNNGEPAFVPESLSFQKMLSEYSCMRFDDRLKCISRRFLGIPYLFDPLGEGDAGDVDRDPLFRFDALDCMTYVEEVLAMAHADSFESFLGTLTNIRYHGGVNAYGLRNHFVEADWIEENSHNGYMRDITLQVGGALVRNMGVQIDRARWIDDKENLTPCEKSTARLELWQMGLDKPRRVSLDYLPVSAFLADGRGRDAPSSLLSERLPEVSIAVFLRKEDAVKKIGAIVAHMGLLIVPVLNGGSRGEPFLRHASSRVNAVIDEPFLPYLRSQEKIRAGVTILAPLNKAERAAPSSEIISPAK